jgi:formylglycine-generating enzyme required for sulfatase activity
MVKGLQMKTPNQTNLRGFIFPMLKPITRAIALAQSLAVILAAPAATAQTRPAATATNTVVSTAEVTAFMQSFRQDPDAVFKISLNPKRVPLLLAAIEREPAALWVHYLQGTCFHVEHAAARKLPPARRSEVYARAIEYLAAAKETVSKALEADPQNRQLKHNLGTLDEGLALAYVESGTRTKEARALAEAVLAANTVTNDWNYGNIIYDMHSLLGRIALREGDMAAAKRHLVESGKTPGSPQLNSFGPDFVLAGELLQKGERDVVLEHLDKIAVFWANPDRNPSRSSSALERQKEIEKWKQTIRAGQIPDDHKWPVAGLSFVTSSPVDETAVRKGGTAKTDEPPSLSGTSMPKQGDVATVDLGGGVKMELVWVPAGSFQMGSPSSESGRSDAEGPVHTVELDGFWMAKYEVTQEQYEAVMGTNPSNFKGAKNPVEQVSWDDATDFCRKASEKTGKSLRLPTEAEWEYACRAGSSTRFCFGDSDNGLDEYAWYTAKSGSKTHQVGEKNPNEWGLYDMHGNVWEWCGDWYADKYGAGSAKNPQGASSGQSRVLRGGSWYDYPNYCRSANRGRGDPTYWNYVYGLGFRVVCVPGQAATPGAPGPGGGANGAGIITSAGFIVTSGGFTVFTNATASTQDSNV